MGVKDTFIYEECMKELDTMLGMKVKKTMKEKKIVKEVKENGKGEFYLEFSDEELTMFGLEKGDKVEWMQLGDREIWKKVTKKEWSI